MSMTFLWQGKFILHLIQDTKGAWLRPIEPEITVWMCNTTLCDEKERINAGPDAKSNDVTYSSNIINLFQKLPV